MEHEAQAREGAPVRTSDFPLGTTVGRYVLLDRLGRGAMGSVFAAFDPTLDRRVALKFVHTSATGALAEEWHERLRREAKAMARLSHPNVVTLYDVGVTSDGRAFLAMELVDGGTLSQWLKQEKRSWREIVDMLVAAGEGLDAAHRMGLIHRDFKLDNVLVGKDGRPRVTDFGIAHLGDAAATGGRPSSAAAVPGWMLPSSPGGTAAQAMTEGMLGTPGYMPPEQYLGEGATDERADIFAFSATLYYALYEQRAFGGDTLTAIAESTLAGRVLPAPAGSEVPAWVHRVITWGLSTDPEDRPATMRAILTALSRDPAAVRRRWLLRGSVALAAFVAALALVAQRRAAANVCAGEDEDLRREAWSPERHDLVERAFAATGKPYAGDAFRGVARALDGYAARWAAARHEACVATRVRHDVSEAVHDRTVVCLQRRREEFKALVDVLVTADGNTVERAVTGAASIGPVDECAAAAAQETAWGTHAAPDEQGPIRADIAKAGALLAAGRSTAARGAAEAALERARAAHDAEAENDALHVLGRAHVALGSYPEARSALLEAASAAVAARDDRRSARSLVYLADVVGERQGQYAAALEWFRLAEASTQRFEPREGVLSVLLTYRALLRYRTSDYDHALEDASRAMTLADAPSNEDPVLPARVLNVEGNVYLDRAQYDASRDAYERALAIYEKQLGRSHPSVAIELGNIALTDQSRGDYAKALELQDRARAIQEAALGPDHPSVALTLCNESAALLRLGRYDDALAGASRALEVFERASGPDHPNVAMAHISMGDALMGLGRAKEALAQYTVGVDVASRTAGADNVLTAGGVLGRASAHLSLGELGPALEDAERAGKTRRAVLGERHPDVAEALMVAGRIRTRQGRPSEAVTRLIEARAIVDASVVAPWLRGEVNDELARATWASTKDRERTSSYAGDAREAYAAAGPGEADRLRSLDAFVASVDHAPGALVPATFARASTR